MESRDVNYIKRFIGIITKCIVSSRDLSGIGDIRIHSRSSNDHDIKMEWGVYYRRYVGDEKLAEDSR